MGPDMHEFDMPESYETTVAMRMHGDLQREFVFLSLPASAVHESNMGLLADPQELLAVIGLDQSAPLRVSQLPDAIFTLLMTDAAEEQEDRGDGASVGWQLISDYTWLEEAQRGENPEVALVAEYLAFAEVVPFEQSRAQVAALATKAVKSYAIGGWLGRGRRPRRLSSARMLLWLMRAPGAR